MRHRLLALGVLAATSLPQAASAHELSSYVSSSGMDALERAIPALAPERLEGLAFSKDFLCITWNQRNTNADIEIHALDLELTSSDRLVVDATFSVSGSGQVNIDGAYACFNEATCDNDFVVRNGRARIEFDLEVKDGKPEITVYSLDLDVSEREEDLDLNLSGCPVDDFGTWLVDFGRDHFLDYFVGLAEEWARTDIAPMVQEMMVGFNGVQADVDKFAFDAQLGKIDVATAGLGVTGNVDVFSKFSPSNCISKDPGEPKSHDGPAPSLDMSDAHVGVSANYGLIDDALYHAWRRGMMCMTDKSLEEFGVDTHHMKDEVAKAMPGFPVGTDFGIEVRVQRPPRVEAGPSGGMVLKAEGLNVDIIGRKPDGSNGSIHVEVDMSIEVKPAVDPMRNVITMSFGEASLDRLIIDDQIEVVEVGFDPARIRHVVGDFIMPAMLEEMSGMPVMAPIFGYENVYIMLKDAGFDKAFLSAQIDLFVAPESDDQAPDTIITGKPSGIVNPRTAVLAFTGNDDQVPRQLLQFELTIDGEPAAPTFRNDATIGVIGETGTYQVEVAAMDLNGNVDPTPETVEIFVDGIAPAVAIRGMRGRGDVEESETIAWTATDDTTDASQLRTSIEIYRLNDRKDSLSKQLVSSHELPAGATETAVDIKDGDLYRVEVVVKDAAGNESRTSVTLKTPGYGAGCSSTGGAGSLPPALALLFLALGFRRRATKSRI